jgi:hypothetical protein
MLERDFPVIKFHQKFRLLNIVIEFYCSRLYNETLISAVSLLDLVGQTQVESSRAMANLIGPDPSGSRSILSEVDREKILDSTGGLIAS